MNGKRIGPNSGTTKGTDVKDTKMLNETARERPSTVTAENNTGRHKSSHKPFGKLGSKGLGE